MTEQDTQKQYGPHDEPAPPNKKRNLWLVVSLGVAAAVIATLLAVYGPWIAAFSSHMGAVSESKAKMESVVKEISVDSEWSEIGKSHEYPADCDGKDLNDCRYYEVKYQTQEPYSDQLAEVYIFKVPGIRQASYQDGNGLESNCRRDAKDAPLHTCKIRGFNNEDGLLVTVEVTDSGADTPVIVTYRVAEQILPR